MQVTDNVLRGPRHGDGRTAFRNAGRFGVAQGARPIVSTHAVGPGERGHHSGTNRRCGGVCQVSRVGRVVVAGFEDDDRATLAVAFEV